VPVKYPRVHGALHHVRRSFMECFPPRSDLVRVS
jgi:hypothetical protein